MISVIIPAYNEENYIEKTLKSLENQSFRDFETIVVANGCSDKTVEIAKKKAKLIRLEKANVSAARNLGAKKAKGDKIVFLDADTRLAENALLEISRFEHAVGVVKGYPNSPRLRYKLVFGLKNIMHSLGLYSGSSGVIVTQTELFHRTKGFDATQKIRENSQLIYELKKHGKYKVITNTHAITSARRYEKLGIARLAYFWLLNRWQTKNVSYEAVR